MPATSKQQQKLMGLALAYKRGDVSSDSVSDNIKKIANAMSEKELEKYAGTKHKGLPKKVSETSISISELQKMVSDAVQEVMNEKFNIKKLTPEQKQMYIEAISKYNEYRSIIHRSSKLPEVVKEIKSLVEFAGKTVVEESADWFEGVTYKREFKKIKESVNDLEKISEKIVKLQKSMESVYESIGQNLGKFYKINNESNNDLQ